MKHILLIVFFLSNTLLWSQFDLLNQWGYGGNQQELPRKSTTSEVLIESKSNISGNKSIANYGGVDAWLVSLDNSNELIEEFIFGGTSEDYPVEIIDFNNRKYLLVSSNSDISGNKSMNNYGSGMEKNDFWLLKLDNNYQIIDQWNYGTILNEGVSGLLPFQDNLILYGASQGSANNDKSENGRGGMDAWIICVDTNGNKLWDKTLGGSSNDHLLQVELLNDGMVLVSQSISDAGFDKTENKLGESDIWIVKCDFNGNKIWDRTYGTEFFDSFYDIMVVNNSLFLTGATTLAPNNNNINITFQHNFDAFILEIDLNDGSLVHSNSFGGNNVDMIRRMFSIPGSNILFVGSSSSIDGDITENSYGMADIWIGIIDSNLNILDQALFGSNQVDYVWHSILKNDKLMVYASSSGGASGIKTSPNYGQEDVWLLELGNILSQHEEDFSIGFNVFPNPTADYLYIDLNQMDANEIRVLDMNGKLTYSKSGKISGLIDVDLSKEKPGIYVVKVGLENGVWVSKKITKR